MGFEKATFAGGCFWCMEAAFQEKDGVVNAVSGYAGGEEKNPTYEQVSSGETGHLEAIQITYDSSRISYEELLDIFWRQIDPTDDGGQFVDRGPQYKTAIFYHNDKQRKLADKSKKQLEESKKFKNKIVTRVLPLSTFYEAEEYHQDYFKKSFLQYNLYKKSSGRDNFIKENWGRFS